MKLPSARALALALTPIKTMSKLDDVVIDVRVQVDETGEWRLHTTPETADDDHSGFWGYERIDQDSDVTVVAASMIDEVKDQLYIHNVKTK